MYLLRIHFENARRNGNGACVIDTKHGKIRKWTCLRAGAGSRELLQLMALACSGFRFLPHLRFELADLLKDKTHDLHLESVHARHAPYDRAAHRTAMTGVGLQLDQAGDVKKVLARDYRHLSNNIEKADLYLGSGNTAFFVLAYAANLTPHQGTDNFEFLDPNFRLTRVGSLFDAASLVTDPVEFLTRLHYRGVQKSRFPAKHTLSTLRELFSQHLDMDTGPWLEKNCDFPRSWRQVKSWQRRVAVLALDAARHMVDAFPRLAKPLHAPGLTLMDRPDRLSTPRELPIWSRLMDRLFPAMQFIVALPENACQRIPASALRGRLPLPEAVRTSNVNQSRRVGAGTIVLVDVDSRLPNLALMKLSRYFKEQGRRVYLARRESLIRGPERVYASCVFYSAASRRCVKKLRDFYGDSLVVGGSGVDIERRLPPEIEAQPPDYDLYPELGDRAIGFLTRGCSFRCRFCIVPSKEGDVRQVTDLDTLLQGGRKKLVLLDDNILSYSKAGELLEQMASRDIQVNFTQTLDLRLLDKEMVRLLRRVRCSNTRFTRSNYHFSLNNARGLDRIRRNYALFGFRNSDNVEFLCMYGFNTTLREDVRRFRFLKSLPGAYVFVQEYQPVIGGPVPRLEAFFDQQADELIDELIQIKYKQNMKSMERYYRWLSKKYGSTFGKLHSGLVDAIFRYNNRERRGQYIASLAGAIEPKRRADNGW